MLMGTAFPPSPDRLSPVGGQASSGYVPERLHPPPSHSTLSCGTTLVYTVIAYSVSLKRQVRVVAVVWPGSRSSRTEVLNSTSITMTAATIIALYRALFLMEFPFRDSKQFAGLSECQSRQVEALHFHWNMAMMAVSYRFRLIP